MQHCRRQVQQRCWQEWASRSLAAALSGRYPASPNRPELRDLAICDAGAGLVYHGQTGDRSKSIGCCFDPAEIEDCPANHSAVADCGVMVLPHPEHGQIVKAFIWPAHRQAHVHGLIEDPHAYRHQGAGTWVITKPGAVPLANLAAPFKQEAPARACQSYNPKPAPISAQCPALKTRQQGNDLPQTNFCQPTSAPPKPTAARQGGRTLDRRPNRARR